MNEPRIHEDQDTEPTFPVKFQEEKPTLEERIGIALHDLIREVLEDLLDERGL